jgi:hypothetical protein
MAQAWPVPHAGPLDTTTGAQRAGIIFPAASRSNTVDSGIYTSPTYANSAANGIRLFIDVTDRHTNGTLTVKVQLQDPASLNWVDIPGATTAAIAATGTTTLTIYPSITETANVDVAAPLGATWRVIATAATAAIDFSIGGEYLA